MLRCCRHHGRAAPCSFLSFCLIVFRLFRLKEKNHALSISPSPGKTGRTPPQPPATSTEPKLSAAAQSRACALGAMKGATQTQTQGRRRRLMSSSACKGTIPAARLALPKSKKVESEQCPISLRDRYSEPGKRLARQKTVKVQLCLLLGTARSQHWEHL